MDIQQIQYFLEVVRSRNFSVAAENLYTTQSSVSKNIKSLEKELNIQLFDRTKRQIQLTEAGKLILKDAHSIVQEYDNLIHTISSYQLQKEDTLSIAGIPVMAQYDITGLLTDFQTAHPNIKLQIEESETTHICSQLKNHECDFIFTRKEYLDTSFESLEFFNDRLAVVVPQDHPLSKKKQISVSELRNENLLLLSKSTLHYDKITEICRQKGYEPRVVYTGTHMDNILDLVGKNHGISLLMQHAVEYLHPSGIVIIPLKEEFSSTITLACNNYHQLSPAGKLFWDYTAQKISDRQKVR